MRVVLVALGLGLAAETALAAPHFLAFFNAPSGGSRGGLRLLSDSNLDWGQDLKMLVEWRKANPHGTLLYGYFGSADPRYYRLDHYDLPGSSVDNARGADPATAPPPVYVAIHASLLQATYLQDPGNPHLPALRDLYAAYRRKTPLTVLGGTIYIYQDR